MIVTIQIELSKTQVDAQEFENKLRYLWDCSQSKELASFNVLLIRMSKASTWELKELKVEP